MTHNKLDQLFKEKLEQVEVRPSQAAFDKFQQQINRDKKSYGWLYIAASVSLIIGVCLWIVLGSTNQGDPMIAQQSAEVEPIQGNEPLTKQEIVEPIPEEEVIDPAPLEEEIQLAVVDEPVEEKINQSATEIVETQPSPNGEIEPDREMIATIEDSMETDAVPTIEESEDQAMIAALETPSQEEVIEKPLPVVRITFISGSKKKAQLAEANVVTDSVDIKNGPINKILNSAKQLTSGSLIADLRDKKENFFNRSND